MSLSKPYNICLKYFFLKSKLKKLFKVGHYIKWDTLYREKSESNEEIHKSVSL